jgi:hypothetical protein
MEVAAEQTRNRSLRKLARRAEERCRESLAGALKSARELGRIPAGSDPELVAAIIIALLNGWVWRGALHGPASLREAVPALHEALRCLLSPKIR